jgi:phenylacetate-CoA ligase
MAEGRLGLAFDIWRAKRQGPDAMMERQRERLAEAVAYAREHSPLYRDLYRDLPPRVEDISLLPVTTKPMLMERFDDWVTDREATYDAARRFLDDKDRVGDLFLDRYLLAATSGTTGHRGLFLLDERTFRIHRALSMRKGIDWFSLGDGLRMLRSGFRTAAILATGDHFAAYTGLMHGLKTSATLRRITHVHSVHEPIEQLVEALNARPPALVVGYARTLAQLGLEQEEGRLRTRPVAIIVTAESLDREEYGRMARAFDTKVHDNYGATEAAELSYGCQHGWHHVNIDWYGLEPVDADHKPVPPGEPSHTVLVTNLVNRVQPILRYDLGDSIVMKPDPCPCGNPLPAIRVQGRSSEVATFRKDDGSRVAIAPMVFTTRLEQVSGLEQYQVVQSDDAALKLRMRMADGADAKTVREEAKAAVKDLLGDRGLSKVKVADAAEDPEMTSGGKYRAVLPLAA